MCCGDVTLTVSEQRQPSWTSHGSWLLLICGLLTPVAVSSSCARTQYSSVLFAIVMKYSAGTYSIRESSYSMLYAQLVLISFAKTSLRPSRAASWRHASRPGRRLNTENRIECFSEKVFNSIQVQAQYIQFYSIQG